MKRCMASSAFFFTRSRSWRSSAVTWGRKTDTSSGLTMWQMADSAVHTVRKLSERRSAWMVATTMMDSSLAGSSSSDTVR
jgi:hypothetical protein